MQYCGWCPQFIFAQCSSILIEALLEHNQVCKKHIGSTDWGEKHGKKDILFVKLYELYDVKTQPIVSSCREVELFGCASGLQLVAGVKQSELHGIVEDPTDPNL